MARINLLPWREQQRKERQRQFFVTLVAVLLMAVAVVFLTERYLHSALTQQNIRNKFINQELLSLSAQITELNDLKVHRQQLIERMRVIQGLQDSRATAVHIFDQLVRTLPDGVFFTDLKMLGQSIFIEGTAESNNLVSSLMRRQAASDWLVTPSLTEIKTVSADTLEQVNIFKLTVQQAVPSSQAE